MKGPRDPGQPAGDRKSVPHAPERDGKFHAHGEKSPSVKQLTQFSEDSKTFSILWNNTRTQNHG